MKLIPVLGALAVLPMVMPAASSSLGDDVPALVAFGRAELAQRQPLPKIRIPGPRDTVGNAAGRQPLLMAQAGGEASVTELEEEIRKLNGRIEELNFQILQMQEQIRKMQEDNEFRFQELEKKHSDAGSTGGRSTKTASNASPRTASNSSTQPRLGEPPRNLGAITMDADGNVVGGEIDPDPAASHPAEQASSPLPGVETGPAAPAGASSDSTTVASLPPTNDPEELYRDSYQFILSGDYRTAEAGFRKHIKDFPDSSRAADAHFWLGEALLSQQKYREAAQVFLTASRDYPDSGKAPEMMLKLGVALKAIDQRDVACATFAEAMRRYPDASSAVRDRLKNEQAQAQC